MANAIIELGGVEKQQQETETAFQTLVKEWKSRKSHSSSIEEMAMEMPYQQIVGLGPPAIPLLLRELEKEPDHWFWALHAITRDDPVPPASRGKISEMANAWIAWGKQRGHPENGIGPNDGPTKWTCPL